jgi:hypothetical protein
LLLLDREAKYGRLKGDRAWATPLLLGACAAASALLRLGVALERERQHDLHPSRVQVEAAAVPALTEVCDVRIGPDRITITWK